MNSIMPKKGKNQNKIPKEQELSSASSTPTEVTENIINSQESIDDNMNLFNDSRNNSNDDVQSSNKNNETIIIEKIKYIEMSNKSVFNYKDFKLDKYNFERWFDALKRHLIAQDLDEFIENDLNLTSMNRNQIKLDNTVQTIIINSLNEETQNCLRGCKTAFHMMERLKRRFYLSGEALLNKLKYKIINLEITNEDYMLYLNELKTLFEQHDNEIKNLNSINKQLKDKNENNINYISNDNNNKIKKSIKKDNRNDNYCHICHASGHNTDNCYNNLLNNRRKENNNKNLNNNKFNNNNNNKNFNKQKNNNNFNNKRKNYKNKYHTNNIEEDIYNNNSDSSSDLNEDETFITFSSANVNVIENCNNIKNENTNNYKNKNKSKNHWIIDCGTGINISNDLNSLKNINKVKDKLIIYPNGNSEKINDAGVYNGKFKENDLKISEVHYAPNIINNLLSTHYILSKGCEIHMKQVKGKDRLQILKNNKIIANILADKENLFSFDSTPDYSLVNSVLNNIHINNINDNSFNSSQMNIDASFDYDLWHARLGHFNNNKNIKDFVTKHITLHKRKNCDQCNISKLKIKPFYNSINNTSEPLELVHSDVVGKLDNSYNNFNYYVTFLDDFTRKCWVYPIKHKNDVSEIFIKFHKLISNITNYKLKTLKSDNGTEYINHNFIDYLNNNGIQFIHSTPGYLQQNGRAERLNQTLNNCCKTLLNAANLPLSFWDFAILCAAHLYNLNPHQSINNKIPDELFFNKPVNINHLKVFGCKVYFKNFHKTNKFDNNSKPGIFLGYSSNSTGYRVLDLSTNKVTTVRDLYFMEQIPGTLNTKFFSNKFITSIIDYPDLSIEGEESNNKDIQLTN
eukprot:jgi/Orpsp1_1/1190131/evm.model.d7180000076770.1